MSKKSFRDNPALQFMSMAEKEVVGGVEVREEKSAEIREVREVTGTANSFRTAPITFEAKSKRFNMLMRPSVFAHLREMSGNRGTSVNDLINTIVENYIENNVKM